MEDIQTKGAEDTQGGEVNTETGEVSGEQAGIETPVDGQGSESTENADANSDGSQKNTDDDIEVVEKDGSKFIPMKAFESRIAKLTAQKNEATSLLESIKNDPEARKEFLASLPKEESEVPNETKESTEDAEALVPWTNFISKLPPEHQSHYNEFVRALAPQFMSAVKQMIKEANAPFIQYVGKSEMTSFKSKVGAEFDKYKPQLAEKMRQHPTLSIEEAFELVSAKDRFNAGRMKGVKEVTTQKTKQNNPSISQGQANGQRSNKVYNDRSEAIRDAASEVEARWSGKK